MISRWFRKAPDIRKATGVRATLNATHRNRLTGEVHGHTWDVLLVFQSTSGQACAVRLRNDLRCLPDKIAWAEDMAEAILQDMTPDPGGYDGRLGEVVAVEISREREGLLAWAYRSRPC